MILRFNERISYSQAGTFGGGGGGGGIPIEFITGNSGGPVPPDAMNNINVLGDTTTINIVGNAGTNTLTVSAVGTGLVQSLTTDDGHIVTPTAGTIIVHGGTGITTTGTVGPNTVTITTAGTVATSYPTDSGTAVPSAGVLDIFGDGHNITTTGSGHQVVVGLTGITQHSLQVGGASNALTQLGVATSGYLPIGSTGADPVLAPLTPGANVTITNGAGSITIAANTGAQVVNYTGVNHAASPYTALSTDYYISADVTAGVISILLPNAPSTGRVFVVKDKVGLSDASNITITTVGGAVNIDGATSYVMNTEYSSVELIFNGTSYEIF